MRNSTLLASVLVAFVIMAAVAAPAAPAGPPLVDQGRAVFQEKCAVCHGVNGDGRGPATYLLFPPPRDLTGGVFKLKSSEVGSIPTDDDLFRTLTHGIPGTAMPSWSSLSEESRWALVAYVKSLSPRFEDEEPEGILEPAPETIADAASIQRGKDVYALMKCAECHGDGGLGDGPAAPTLKDAWGYHIRAFNFTSGYKMRGGGNPRDIYKTFTMGLEGTPMPAYGPILTNEQSWDLVHYVQTLGVRPAPFPAADDAEITVWSVATDIAMDPNDPQWQNVPVVGIPLRPLWTRDDAADYVQVRALTNGKEIGFYIEWPDPMPDDGVLRHQDFRDSVAIQFPLEPTPTEEAAPFYGMGERARAVNIWHWKADWQADLALFGDVRSQYPAQANDMYLRDATERRTYTTGWAAGNLISTPDRRTAVEDLNATGQGTLTSQAADDQNVDGRGVWAGGTWRVVIRRSLKGDGKADVRFPTDGRDGFRIAIAVWDGEAGDRDGQKSISEWHPLRLEQRSGPARWRSAAVTP